MEHKDLLDGPIGSEAAYDIDFVGGNIIMELKYNGLQASAGVYAKINLINVLEIAASKSDNKIDDQVVAMIKGMLL